VGQLYFLFTQVNFEVETIFLKSVKSRDKPKIRPANITFRNKTETTKADGTKR
jgi:hypothetical protein